VRGVPSWLEASMFCYKLSIVDNCLRWKSEKIIPGSINIISDYRRRG
jgi:hypothetical protein